MKKFYYLGTCSTCSKIINNHQLDKFFEMREIKTSPLTEEEVDLMAKMAGSYEAIFSKRSMKYKAWGLKEKNLGEADFKKYILEEYTFLKRPVAILNEQIFVGNSPKNVEALAAALENE